VNSNDSAITRQLDPLPPSGSRPAAKSHRIAPVITAILIVIVGYSGPVLIVKQAAEAANLSAQQVDSWIFAVTFGSGICGLILSWWSRQPIIVAFSSAGHVLLLTSLSGYRYSDAIGAFIAVALASLAIGLSRTFSVLLARIPKAIVSAMLCGVLLRFGSGLFAALPGDPRRWQTTMLVLAMIATFFVSRSFGSKVATVWTCAVGALFAFVLRLTQTSHVHLAIASPHFSAPTFSVRAMTGLALPLLAVALSSQYAPGYAVLTSSGYEPPMDRILGVTGGIGAIMALFGSPGLNLAAITAGMATGPDAHPDPKRRYTAGITTGFANILAGLLGVSLLSVFTPFPKEYVAAITGLALFGSISSSMFGALSNPHEREAGVATLLCAASGFTLFGIGSPFWALLVGISLEALQRSARARTSNT
jgi:benzoate membrane transport protein